MSMGKRPAKTPEEHDLVSRRVYAYLQRAVVKRAARRRERREGKREMRGPE